MKYFYPLGLVGAVLLAGCHRDAERISYDLTGKYTAASTLVATNPVAMYTAAGQVTNQAVISRFLARRPPLSTYFSATDVPAPSSTKLTLTFRANNRATLVFTSPTATDSIRTEVTDQQLASFRLQSLDSVANYTSGTTYCTRTTELSSYIKDVYPGKRCMAVSPVTGYSQYCKTRPVRVIGAHGNQLYVPYFSWLVQGGGCSLAYSGEWNTFNRAVLSHLAVGDTIVLQEREIALKK